MDEPQLALFDVDNGERSVLLNARVKQEFAVPEAEQPQDVEESIAQIRRAAAAIVARIKPLASVKGKDASAMAQLERAVEALGDEAKLSDALAATAKQARELTAEARQGRSVAFGKAVAEFLRTAGASSRETGVGWRVGLIELEQRPEEATLRARYNREPITDWQPIASASDLAAMYERAEARLKDTEIAEHDLPEVFLEAFAHAEKGERGSRVRLRDLLTEVRVALVRRALQKRRRTDARLALDLPPAALLYNADRYRALASGISKEDRLRFETGGQRETQQIGVVLNGLNPERQYESYCYVRRGG